MRSLSTPLAIILAALVIVLGAAYNGQSIWIVLTAIGTVGAVVWAIFHQEILTRLRQPILEIRPFEQEPPYFRQTDEFHPGTSKKVGVGYYINIPIRNRGKTLAKNCQAFIITMGHIDAGKWQQDKNWLPKGLWWTFEGPGEKNLVPDKPDQFSLGSLSIKQPDKFFLSTTFLTTGQPFDFDPGKYCFELKVFAENARSISKFFHVEWDGGCTDNFEEVKTRIRIFATDDPPWSIKIRKETST